MINSFNHEFLLVLINCNSKKELCLKKLFFIMLFRNINYFFIKIGFKFKNIAFYNYYLLKHLIFFFYDANYF